MERVLQNLMPERVFKYFEEISAIPRQTGNCKNISDYLVNFAKEHELYYVQDQYFNVYIRKESNNGRQSVILQGHMDMVCEKNYDINAKHDFTKDGLSLKVMDDYIYANGTTLGADDGIAIAYILSVLDEDNDEYPPIEAVFTVDEENGMKGALSFETEILTGKKLINLDHEVEGELLTCCAGGRRVKCSFDAEYEMVDGVLYSLTVCGLCGGHSGVEIDKGRGNANLLLGRALHYIGKRMNFELSYIGGGLIDSAIPREAKAEIIIDASDIEKMEDLVLDFSKTVKNEYEGIEENLMIYCENQGQTSAKVVTTKVKKKIGFLINTLPDGIINMSRKSDGLVKTSLNCGIMTLNDKNFSMIINMRSLVESEKEALCDKIEYLVEAMGGDFTIEFDYPAWEFNEDSELRDIAFDVFQKTFGRNPKLKGFHAGLECGVFYNKIKGLDIVSFGPDIKSIHTPKERLCISSAYRVYNYFTNLLKEC